MAGFTAEEWTRIVAARTHYAGEPLAREAAEFVESSVRAPRWDSLSDDDKFNWLSWFRQVFGHLTEGQRFSWMQAHPEPEDEADLASEAEVFDLGGGYYNADGERVGGKYDRPSRPHRASGDAPTCGRRYRGKPRDRSKDPYYVFTPANVVGAVEEKRLDASVIPYASVLYQHIRRSERYKDKGQRIRCAEIGASLHRSERSARRAIDAMVAAGELHVVSSGRGNRNGAIYRFPPRGNRT